MIIDYSSCKTNNKFYGGSERKEGITINGVDFLIKYQKKTAFGKRNNHISEFIGSHVFELCGIRAHETFLGLRNGEQVVACKDFNQEGMQFVPFNDVGESTLDHDKDTYQYDYSDIMKMLYDNSKLTDVRQCVSMFWNIYIVDALLGNFDRHGSNWGFLKHDNRYSLAPVFDNGSCLFPNMTDESEMIEIIRSKAETEKRVYQFPTSQVRINGRKSSYYEVISSLEFDECNKALMYVVKHLNMHDVDKLVNETPFISEIQKKFYLHMLWARYNLIIKESFERLNKSGI